VVAKSLNAEEKKYAERTEPVEISLTRRLVEKDTEESKQMNIN